MDTRMETSESLRAEHDRVLKRIHELEAEKAGCIARGDSVPGRITSYLQELRIQLDEYRLWGHRAMVREAQEAQRKAAERGMRGRVEAEVQRIRNAPAVDAADIRERRRELGATQQQLATFSGVYVGTISKIENGFDRFEPRTLQLIAAGLESIREFKGRA